jgi:hypothetical protein
MLNEEGVRMVIENNLPSTRNPNLKLGRITYQGDDFVNEIITKVGSLVDKLLVNKSTRWMHPTNQTERNLY